MSRGGSSRRRQYLTTVIASLLRVQQHETAERLEVLRRADRYEHALGVKDHMLWVAMQVSCSCEKNYQEIATSSPCSCASQESLTVEYGCSRAIASPSSSRYISNLGLYSKDVYFLAANCRPTLARGSTAATGQTADR